MIQSQKVPTLLGEIHLEMNIREGTLPIIFLHGLYFDRHLWDVQIREITDRTVIAMDMPYHGENKDKPRNWNLQDCATMLLQILDALHIDRVIAVGHSWGGMTILRGAVRVPDRFSAIGLCNMPLQQGSKWDLPKYYLISSLLPFRTFYAKQVAKVQFAPDSLNSHPALYQRLQQDMLKMSDADIRQVDIPVRIIQDDGFRFISELTVPTLALKGKTDYVPIPAGIKTTLVQGGHVSPLEAPDEVSQFIREVIALAV